MSVGENIRKARIAIGLKQSELAAMVNTSQSMIAQYESGKRTPKTDKLSKIATALGRDISDLDSDYNSKRDLVYDPWVLPKTLVFIRNSLGLSIEDASKIVNIAPSILDSYEQTELLIPEKSLHAIADNYSDYCKSKKTLENELDSLGITIALGYLYLTFECEELKRIIGETAITTSEHTLLKQFSNLNSKGKSIALDRIKELCEIPRYITDNNTSNKQYIIALNGDE